MRSILKLYINDKNSSTLREFITTSIAGYKHIGTKIGSKRRIAMAINNLGVIYAILGDYSKAFEYFKQSLQEVRKGSSKINEALTLMNLGLILKDKKDYQQSLVVRKMVLDLNYDTKIVTCPIAREEDKVAMSSRNRYLTKEERKHATVLFKSLERARWLIAQGERRAGSIKAEIKKMIKETSGEIDYVK